MNLPRFSLVLSYAKEVVRAYFRVVHATRVDPPLSASHMLVSKRKLLFYETKRLMTDLREVKADQRFI